MTEYKHSLVLRYLLNSVVAEWLLEDCSHGSAELLNESTEYIILKARTRGCHVAPTVVRLGLADCAVIKRKSPIYPPQGLSCSCWTVLLIVLLRLDTKWRCATTASGTELRLHHQLGVQIAYLLHQIVIWLLWRRAIKYKKRRIERSGASGSVLFWLLELSNSSVVWTQIRSPPQVISSLTRWILRLRVLLDRLFSVDLIHWQHT